MLKSLITLVYQKIKVASYFSRLDTLDTFYSDKNDVYLEEMKKFLDELHRFVELHLDIAKKSQLVQPAATFYSTHESLLSALEKSVNTGDTVTLHSMSRNIRNFLDSLFQAFSFRSVFPKSTRKWGWVAVCIAFTLVGWKTYTALRGEYIEEKKERFLALHEEDLKKQTYNDLLALNDALSKYRRDKQSYPDTKGNWQGISCSFGKSTPDWIPGLAPGYIKNLPIDPRKSESSTTQYMYRSDGKDYKLIAHLGMGIKEISGSHPEMIDPARPTWSFGVWSEGGKNW